MTKGQVICHLPGLLFDHLEFFRRFDEMKVYHDDGLGIAKRTPDQPIGFILSKSVIKRRKTSMTDYRCFLDHNHRVELRILNG